MKKNIIALLFLFIASFTYSQSALHNLLQSLREVSEVNISKSNRGNFFLGSDDITVFKSNKVVELYKDLSVEPEICLVPINISNDLNVYVKIPILFFKEEKNSIIFNVFNSYIIFDKNRNVFYQINSEFACGSIYKKNKKTLVINSSFAKLTQNTFELDKNLEVLEKE
ncbi:hypothetical protein [Flavobacterium anhuiense]|uniref:hypothetical protein n=1 Tax=Flavobacterium anhuiense TaxID=459526 RepID=UPI003D98F8EE